MTGARGEDRVMDGVVSGNEIRFTVVYSVGGQSIEVSFGGTVEGDRIEGTGEASFGGRDVSFEWSAERTSDEPDPGMDVRGGTR